MAWRPILRLMLTVPPALGYGRKGNLPRVPGNATLTLEVELLTAVVEVAGLVGVSVPTTAALARVRG